MMEHIYCYTWISKRFHELISPEGITDEYEVRFLTSYKQIKLNSMNKEELDTTEADNHVGITGIPNGDTMSDTE